MIALLLAAAATVAPAAPSPSALLHSTMVTSGPLIPDSAPMGPMPQNGVWALVPSDCDAPTSLDLSTWPKCATPIGFADDEVAALERPAPGNKATPDQFFSVARTKYATASAAAADAPAVVQVAVPILLSRSYYYLALTPAGPLDADGRFAEAKGWPVACLPKGQGGCKPKTLADVQTQAAVAPTDPKRLYRMIRILVAAPAPPAPAPSAPITETQLPPAAPSPAVSAPASSQSPSTRGPQR